MFSLFKKKDAKNYLEYAKLVNDKVNEIKEYFLGFVKYTKGFNKNDVEYFLKLDGGKFDKLQSNYENKDLWFHYSGFESFVFILNLQDLPKEFTLTVMGFDNYEGFILTSFSNENKFRLSTKKSTRLAKKLQNEMLKIPGYDDFD